MIVDYYWGCFLLLLHINPIIYIEINKILIIFCIDYTTGGHLPTGLGLSGDFSVIR